MKRVVIIKNKARLIVQGFNQEEGTDYDETFAPMAILEVIRILIALSCFRIFNYLKET